MLTARAIFAALEAGQVVLGRHVVVTAHPDDETISFGGALPLLASVTIVQLTDGVSRTVDRGALVAARQQERDAALQVLRPQNPGPVVWDCGTGGRQTLQELLPLLAQVRAAIEAADVVWTHPYEGGHVDHDAAAWLVQRACADRPDVLRLEFASYHSHGRKSTFGAFWPDPTVAQVTVQLTGERLARKRAAIACYASQAHILRKFPTIDREPYRVAPVYDFTRPSPAPQSRWDSRGYLPTMTTFRAAVAEAEREVAEVSA